MAAGNAVFTAFEKYYKEFVEALPMDAMYPTLVSKGLLHDPVLSEKLRTAKTNSAKVRLFLDAMRPALHLGLTRRFENFLDAMAEYEMSTKDEVVKELLSRIRQDLPSSPTKQVKLEQTSSVPGASMMYNNFCQYTI